MTELTLRVADEATLTYKEIIDDTVSYYSENVTLRAQLADGSCVYTEPKTHRHCAIGRWLSPEGVLLTQGSTQNARGLDETMARLDVGANLDTLLVPAVRGKPLDFWVALQQLHDNGDYWDLSGLTAIGLCKVNSLLETWGGIDEASNS